MRFVSLNVTGEGRKRLVKYEVPFFCEVCGIIGHDHEECVVTGDGVWEEKQFQYGSWMLAVRRANQPAPAPRRFVPRAPARGGWTGRGGALGVVSRKRSSGDASMEDSDDLSDTGSSPLKNGPTNEATENDENVKARRKLELGNLETDGMVISDGNVPNTDSNLLVPPPPLAYVKSIYIYTSIPNNKVRKVSIVNHIF
jgi:hypothetical protein